MSNVHFGNKLESLRGKFRLGQKEVADYLCVSIDKYGRMERTEKPPSIDKLEKLAVLYKMTIKQLEEYDPTSSTTNNFYEKVMQVNHIGSMVVSSLDNAFEKVLKEPDLWNGEEVTLAITFKIVKKAV